MATNKIQKKTERGLGTSDTKTIDEMFPAAPDDFDPEVFMKLLLDGVKSYNPDLGSFDMDYGKAPKITDFVPNPTSPGPGDVNPNNKPPAPSNWPPPASGFGSQTSPSETSEKIAEQEFDKLTPGKA